MKAGDACNRVVIDVTEDEPVSRAAELMRKYHVGTLVVTRFGDDQHLPVGILTDRDIVVETVAAGIDPEEVTVGDIMSDKLAQAAEDDELSDVLELMRKKGVRRIPVVNVQGGLVGVLAVDDVLQLCADDIAAMAAIVGGQRRQETKLRA